MVFLFSFLGFFSSLFTGIREAEYNPFQTNQPLCMQIPFCSMKEAQTPAEVHLTCPLGLQLLPIITLGINSLSWLWSVDRNVGASIVIFSPAFFVCFPHFVEIWAQKFLEAPSLSSCLMLSILYFFWVIGAEVKMNWMTVIYILPLLMTCIYGWIDDSAAKNTRLFCSEDLALIPSAHKTAQNCL